MNKEAIKAINDAISSIDMYCCNTSMENIMEAINHVGITTEHLRRICGDEVADHFNTIAIYRLNEVVL